MIIFVNAITNTKERNCGMKKNAIYRTDQLFNMVNEKLMEDGLLPDILDYSLSSRYSFPVKNVEWDCVGRVNFGGSEGIYLDLYLEGNTGSEEVIDGDDVKESRILIGTYKTLLTDRDAYRAMCILQAEFVYTLKDFVRDHWDDFNRTGHSIHFYRDGEKRMAYYATTMERAKSLASVGFAQYGYDYAIIIDNETGEEERIENTLGGK